MNLLEQLENNEAVLLMYLAGELPAEDREEVVQMLSTDKRLRDELEQLRATVADANTMVGSADGATRLPIAESVAVRNTLRAIRHYRLTHPHQEAPAVADKGLRYPWWTYPSSAAAMLLLSALVWWGMRSDTYVEPLASRDVVPVWTTDVDNERPAFAQVDDLDRAYMELQNLADGL